MKKSLFIFITLFLIQFSLIAKTSYVPSYYTQINIEGTNTMADSTIQRELTTISTDGRYSITVLHDSVTAERVKAIKNTKAAAGWATALSVVSGVSAMLNPMHTSWDAVNYMSDMNLMASSTMLHVAASSAAANLQRVSITIRIENMSDKEMVINDMKRGLTWYVPAKNYIQLSIGNPEINKFRIAYADYEIKAKDYITIQSANFLEKQIISYDDDDIWIIPAFNNVNNSNILANVILDHYVQINKITFERKKLSIDQFKTFQKEIKAKVKKNKNSSNDDIYYTK